MDDLPRIVVVGALILGSWAAFGHKLVLLRRDPGNPSLRVLCLTLGMLAVAMSAQFAAPWIDGVTGIANLGRFLGNAATMVALGGGYGFLLLRSHDEAGTPLTTRWQLTGLAVALVSATVLFALTPPQPAASLGVDARPVHVLYSSPYVYVYAGYVAFIEVKVGIVTWRYARLADRTALRAGLRMLTVSSVFGVLYCAVKAGALTAGYFLLDGVGEFEYAAGSVLYLLTVLFGLVGLMMPPLARHTGKAAEWLRLYRAYRRLFPLWQALYAADPTITLLPEASAAGRSRRFRRLRFYLYRTVIEIRDGQLALRPHIDDDVLTRARALTAPDGSRAALEAATIHLALRADPAEGRTRPATAHLAPVTQEAGFLDEVRHLEQIARHFRRFSRGPSSRGAHASAHR
ncbi:MAB_1171c family putative transporter [Rhizohabitans arisaemae]|uniref:MAB_1171c family putative transporter n=1 Tax=Rhizohabitans arisaemae TaxID=2720610 RepID=UPI0024B07F86|nr:MAB_1171c family putative transporter [Rhizohabitans arisaemae]